MAASRRSPITASSSSSPTATLLECALETGRTHQIRVHMASIGHPLVGDPVYGKARSASPGVSRQALHATRLAWSIR